MSRVGNPVPSISKSMGLRSKHAPNTTVEGDRDQDDWFYSSEKSELRQPLLLFELQTKL